MRIARELPPNYEEIVKTLNPGPSACFCYDGTLYAPSLPEGVVPEDHLLVHEEVHVKQQGEVAHEWWREYLADPEFRLEQELQAYGTQYAFVKRKNIKAAQLNNFLERIAGDLASPMYGDILTQGQAESKIRNRAKELSKAVVL